MSEKHQKLSLQPSAASRWLKCKASPGFIQQHADAIPDDSSEWADEGTQAHDLGACLLKNTADRPIVSDEMLAHVSEYVDFVRAKVEPDHTLFVEQKVPLFYMPDRHGYVDAAVIGPKSIYIADLKYGVGVSVEAKKNAQLAIYGLSFIDYLISSGLYDSFDPNTLVTLAIYQPRARDGRVTRLWPLSLSELLDFCAEILATAKAIQEDPLNQPFAPSEDPYCASFCPANGLCGERAKHLLAGVPAEVAKPLESVLTLPDVAKLDVETLAKIVLAAKPLEAFFESARKRAYGLLEGGTVVPGCKLVQGRGSRSWKDEAEARRLLMLKFPVDECAPRELVSPAGAEKLLKKIEVSTKFTNLLQAQIKENDGKLTLVPESDPRPALNPAALTEGLTNLDAPAALLE